MARDMSRVGACKPGSEESGISHGHPDDWGPQGPIMRDAEEEGSGKRGQGRGVAEKKDHRKDAGGGEGY